MAPQSTASCIYVAFTAIHTERCKPLTCSGHAEKVTDRRRPLSRATPQRVSVVSNLDLLRPDDLFLVRQLLLLLLLDERIRRLVVRLDAAAKLDALRARRAVLVRLGRQAGVTSETSEQAAKSATTAISRRYLGEVSARSRLEAEELLEGAVLLAPRLELVA